VPRDERLLPAYQKYPKITEIFSVNSVGVVTSRDNFVISTDKADLENRIRMFRNENITDSQIKQSFYLKDKTNWKVKKAREKIRAEENWEKQIIPILYRPFDLRWIFYNDAVVERTRKEVMRHMLRENLALCVGRAGHVVGIEKLWNIAFCTECCADLNLFYRGGNVLFPLHVYPDEDLYNNNKNNTYQHEANIKLRVFAALEKEYRKESKPEDIFYYIYAVLYSNIYRQKYAEFLKSDFPRIPFCVNYDLFQTMGKLGRELADLHLMKSKKLDKPSAKFEGKGDYLVKKICYDEKESLVYINPDQFFGSVSKEVWQYQIGGYQVMDNWLKYRKRKGQRLSLEDIKHYCKIATVIKETIAIQKKIDRIYPDVEKQTVTF
jgi:predicted helicase